VTAPETPAEPGEELVGRCYTKARRTPLVVGVVPGVMPLGGGDGRRSIRLPFGPYTVTQLAALVVTCALLILARPLWGGHGLVDVAVVIGVPFAVAFALRHLHVDGRNPVAAAVSIASMLTAPAHGRLRGRPYRPAVARRNVTRLTVAADGPGPSSGGAEAAADPACLPDQPLRAPRPEHAAAATGGIASGVQTLLARPADGKD